MPAQKLNAEILNAAIQGFEAQKSRIDAQIAEIRQMLAVGRTGPGTATEPQKRKRKMSAAARKRIGDAQRKRWALSKSQSEPSLKSVTQETPKKKRKLSAAGRRAIIAATKKRWASIRAATETGSQSVATKPPGRRLRKEWRRRDRKRLQKLQRRFPRKLPPSS